MKKLISIFLVLLLPGIQAITQDLMWSVSTDTLNVFYGTDIRTDMDKNIYIGVDGYMSAYIIKYNENGMLQAIMGDNENARYQSMTMDDNGRLYLVGEKKLNTDWDAMIMVFENDGNPVFTQYYNYLGKDDEYRDVCIDAAGNIYVCGHSNDLNYETCVTVASYAPDGTPRWFQQYDLPGRYMSGRSIRVGNNGEVHVMCTNMAMNFDYKILSLVYSTDGLLLSEYSDNIPGYNEIHPTFSLLDEDNNHYIGGYTYGPDEAAFLMRLTGNSPVWTYVVNAPGNTASFEKGSFDADGNIVCCGQYFNTSLDAYFARFSTVGGLLQEGFYDSPSGLGDVFLDVAVTDDYIYFCGATDGLGTNTDMLAIKVDYNFTKMWDIIYNSFTNDVEAAYGIGLDPDGNVVMTGPSIGTGGYKCRTWKYTNPLGVDEMPVLHQGGIAIYPNPALEELHFSLEAENMPARFEICRLTGQVVLGGMLQQGPGQRIDIAALTPGAYILVVYDGTERYRGKFVKK